MQNLKTVITEQLTADGIPGTDALLAAGHIIERLQVLHGGTRLYIPSHRQQREAAILRDWKNGKAPKAIADMRGVDPATVYRVIDRHRSRPDDDDTGFGSDDWQL